VLADSGSGIFSVAYATVQAGHIVLFRLTKSRFKPLRRQATLIVSGHQVSATWAWLAEGSGQGLMVR